MNHRYKGNTPVKAGDMVDLIANGGEVYHTTKVNDALATQFIVSVNKRARFFFYEDRGVTWQKSQK